jgi:hypothetical protein
MLKFLVFDQLISCVVIKLIIVMEGRYPTIDPAPGRLTPLTQHVNNPLSVLAERDDDTEALELVTWIAPVHSW